MSGDQRPGRRSDQQPDHGPAEDDVVVPHPFGPGSLGERPVGASGGQDEPVVEVESAPAGPAEPVTDAEVVTDAESGAESCDETSDGTGAEVEADPEDRSPPEHPDEPSASADPTPESAAEPTRRTRDPLAAALIGVLTLLLGFAFAVQVRAVGEDQDYSGAREEDLVRILDDLNAREERLRDQIADQRNALEQLTSSDSRSAAALEEARARAEAIGILNGTIAAQGPGLVITIRDPDDEVRVSDIVDAIQELRGAGAETMQIDGVRVGVSTAVTGTPGSLMVDGRPITSPYEFVVIGSPQDMQTALNIPGGVVQDLTRHGASVDIQPSDQVVVDALRPLDAPEYASPDTDD